MRIRFALALAALLACPSLALAAPITATSISSGTLSVDNGQLVPGTTGWNDAVLDYDVFFDPVTEFWWYEYTFDINQTSHAISHLITELSPNFEWDDFEDGTSAGHSASIELNKPSDATGANPSMPFDLYGWKSGTGDSTVYSWTFVTLRSPMWGNFYAKDGSGYWAYNEGFDDVPLDDCYKQLFLDVASCSGFLLVPDTVRLPPPPDEPLNPVPEPATLTLLGVGLLGAAWVRRRSAKRAQ